MIVEWSRAVGEPVFSLAMVREFWERDGFDPARDVWIAADDGVAGFGELHTSQDAFVRVRPGHEDGLHAALLAALEAEARARGMDFVASNIPDTDVAGLAALEAAGYEKSREVWRMYAEHTQEPRRRASPRASTSGRTPTTTRRRCTGCSTPPTAGGTTSTFRCPTTSGSRS